MITASSYTYIFFHFVSCPDVCLFYIVFVSRVLAIPLSFMSRKSISFLRNIPPVCKNPQNLMSLNGTRNNEDKRWEPLATLGLTVYRWRHSYFRESLAAEIAFLDSLTDHQLTVRYDPQDVW